MAKFHIGLILQYWYTDLIMEADPSFHHEPIILTTSNQEFSSVEYVADINFSYLKTIQENYIFTKEVCEELFQKQLYRKRFDIMKKTLNLVIATGRVEELYQIHVKLAKKMEAEIDGQVENNDNITEFTSTISNPISIRKKDWKPKCNINQKDKGKEIFKLEQHEDSS